MQQLDYTDFLEKHADRFSCLRERGIYFVSDIKNGGELDDPVYRDYNATCFTGNSLNCAADLLSSAYLEDYRFPVVIEFPKALDLYQAGGAGDTKHAAEALELARCNFMGTDGMRGRVVEAGSDAAVFTDYFTANILSPRIVELAAIGFSRMLVASGVAAENDTMCVGNDGRDRAVDGLLSRAMISGFRAGGMQVLDQGIIPTPYVPYQILNKGLPGGAVLTASHNPSNQNGIKFFIGGKKLLPEGQTGEYSLSAWMFEAYRRNLRDTSTSLEFHRLETAEEEALSFMLDVLPSDLGVICADTPIILDTANGAYSAVARNICDSYAMNYVCVNPPANGRNINQDCGVAEIEGIEQFSAEAYDQAIPVVRAVFDAGRQHGSAWGIVLDGDGDRGFVLAYARDGDLVYVLDGDRCGYLLARHKKADPESFFVCTVESDLMTSFNAASKLGYRTETVSVGDKWISSFDKAPLAIGLEASGHLILPLSFTAENGSRCMLKSGNGMLTALMTLYAVFSGDTAFAEIVEPYEPGFTRTAYTYISDRSLFYRGSSVWRQDTQLIRQGLEKLIDSAEGLRGATVVFLEKEDRHMLYAALMIGEIVQAAVFCRNSGTEEKTAVYVQGPQWLAEGLEAISHEIAEFHRSVLKNTQRPEYEWEQLLLSEIEREGSVQISEAHRLIEEKTGSSASESDLMALVYGLRKEGRIDMRTQELLPVQK